MPSLRQLEYLVALADLRHFRRAAERVHTTQPTLSGQIKALENQLNVQLIVRSQTGAVVTPIGSTIVELARRMLGDAQAIRDLARDGGKTVSGATRIGVTSCIGPYILPQIIADLYRTLPDLNLVIHERHAPELPRHLEEGQLDLILTHLPVVSTNLKATVLFREPFYLVVARDHPLANRESIGRAELNGLQLLIFSREQQHFCEIEAVCAEFGAQIRHDFDGASLDMLREMIATGHGVAFLPGLYVNRSLHHDESQKALRLLGKPIERTIVTAWRKSTPCEGRYRRIVELIASAVRRDFPGFRSTSTAAFQLPKQSDLTHPSSADPCETS